jgi:PAS domain S-box-containing protein
MVPERKSKTPNAHDSETARSVRPVRFTVHTKVGVDFLRVGVACSQPTLARGEALTDDMRVAIDTIPGLVWSALPDGSVDFLNQRWCDYTGLAMEQACGWGWQAAVCADDLPGLLDKWQKILGSNAPGEAVARLKRSDGTLRWFLFRAVPLHDAAGRVVKWYGQTTDIDDQKRVEMLLAGEKRLLEMTAMGSPLSSILDALCRIVEEVTPNCLCGIVLVDPTGTFLEHGAAPSLPQSYNDAIHGRPVGPDSGPCAMAAFVKEQVIADDIASDTRWEAYAWCPLALTHGFRACWSTPILSSEGVALGTFALYSHTPGGPTPEQRNVIAQMTHLAAVAIERGRTEKALQESEHRLRLIAEAVPQVIWLTAVRPEHVLYVSPSFERVWGLSVAELYRNPRLWMETIHPDDRERVSRVFSKWLSGETESEYEIEFRIIQSTGAIRWIHERGVLILDERGAPDRASGISTDVTDRKRSEEALRSSEEALNEMRTELAHVSRVYTLGALTASIAHEVNQPLSGILTNADTCLKLLGDDPPDVDGARETAERTIRDANRASEVIVRLRALFKKKKSAREPVDLNHAIQDVVALMRTEAQKHGVVFHLDFMPELPPITGDRVQLQQVALNLLRNAIEAMRDVRDRTRELHVTTRLHPDEVRMTVRDSGPGLDGDNLERIFKPFYTSKSEGMGMGLSISRSIVESHGGRLWAEPHVGGGVAFVVTLPTNVSEDAAGQSKTSDASRLHTASSGGA